MNHTRTTILVTISLLLLVSNMPVASAEPATASDCGIIIRDVFTGNCGDIHVDITVDEESCEAIDSTTLLCSVVSSASANATDWLTPGAVDLALPCGDAVSASWAIGGTIDPLTTSCSELDTFTRGTCETVSVTGEAAFSGTANPGVLNATASSTFCAPVPEGPAIALYSDPLFEGCSTAFDDDVADFSLHDYDSCSGTSVDDSVSSLVLREDCTGVLYVDAGFEGSSKTFLPGEHTYVGLEFDDMFSSLELTCLF